MQTTLGTGVFWVFVGNYGKKEPHGIHLLRYSPGLGTLSSEGSAGPAEAPNWVAVHPNGQFLYAVTATRVDDSPYSGAVEAFAIDPTTGKLTFLNRQDSGGDNPAHLAIHPSGKVAIVANYSGGTVAAFPIGEDGKLGEACATVQHHGSSINPKRQGEPHPHGITFDPTGSAILVPDLGMDRLLKYRVNVESCTLSAGAVAVVPAGSGPRHAAFGKDGRFVYVINELTYTLSVLTYEETQDGRRMMRDIQTLTVWPEKAGASGAEIEVHPSGRFLYASNRGHDSIAICAIDPASGKLELIGTHPTGGRTPRHFGLDPAGEFVLASNMDSNTVVLLKVDQASGKLTDTGIKAECEAPCCVAFVPVGNAKV
jgi:6-phosphogluconolactonase